MLTDPPATEGAGGATMTARPDDDTNAVRPYRDLREWLDIARELGLLKELDGAHWDLEIGAITEIERRRRLEGSSVLLFDRIAGYPEGYRVLTNADNPIPLVARSLGLPAARGGLAFVREWKERMKRFEPLPPARVEAGPVLENVFRGPAIDVLKFPVPRWNELDGGRYIGTDCVVITRDPEEGWVNLGTYRVQVHDRDRLGLYISPGKDGRIQMEKAFARNERFPVAMTFGQDPLLLYAASFHLPWGTCEYDYAGWARRAPIEVIAGPVTGLPIPAHAEIAIEGFVDPGEVQDEGPFGEFTGYYASDRRPAPVVHVESLMHRNRPILTGSPMGRPPSVVFYDLITSATLWNAMEAAGVPDVRGVYVHHMAPTTMFTAISITQRYPGHARQAGAAAIACRGGAYMGRYYVVVDEDIDPSNIDEVIWAMATRSDPEKDIEVLRRCWSGPLDPIVPPGEKGFNSRAIIDACRPYEWRNEFPRVVESSPALRARVLEKWGHIIG
ncbi:MAG: UbiD family decarboxylase [Burkholderiales bacterium]|nr:UbiD family decarboxylase [Burkholderiales bacterium]